MSWIATDIDGIFLVGTFRDALDLAGIVQVAPAPQSTGDDLRLLVVNHLTRYEDAVRRLVWARLARHIARREAAFDRLTQRLQLTVFL